MPQIRDRTVKHINHWNYSFIDERGALGGEAIFHMKSKVPNSDGTIGYMVQPGSPEWRAWDAYFSQTERKRTGQVVPRFPVQLAHMRAKGAQNKPFHVPDQLPWLFDETFSPASVPQPKRDRMSSEMTIEERNRMVARVLERINSPEFNEGKARCKWERDMCASVPQDRIGAYMDILIERPDLCEVATTMELTPKGYGLGWGEISARVEQIYWQKRADRSAA